MSGWPTRVIPKNATSNSLRTIGTKKQNLPSPPVTGNRETFGRVHAYIIQPFSTWDASPRLQFINSTAGFIQCRNLVNAAAEQCLPRHFMDQFANFKHEKDMCQQPLPSAGVASADMTLEDVQAVAKLVR